MKSILIALGLTGLMISILLINASRSIPFVDEDLDMELE